MDEYIKRKELAEMIENNVNLPFGEGYTGKDHELVEWCKGECIRMAHCLPFVCDVVPKSEVVRCKDCVYFQPDFVLTNNGERRPYTEEEKNSTLGMVTGDVGVNCGSRCERFDYWEDNRFPVWFQENDYCSYFKKKHTEEYT